MLTNYIFCLVFLGAIAYPAESFQGIQNRIAGGEVAKINQFPYQVRLTLKKLNEYGFSQTSLCGGILISNKIILTAGHCLDGVLMGTAHLGTIDLDKNEPTRIEIPLTWRNIIVHESFKYGGYNNDIGIVRLTESVKFNDAIQPISLPKGEMDLENRMGIISGYGKTHYYETHTELRFVPRKILPNYKCQMAYKQYNETIHLCVDGSGGKGACQGDSGGPLIVEDFNGRVAVGITSFGDPHCGGGSHIVYTKISKYLDWIRKHM